MMNKILLLLLIPFLSLSQNIEDIFKNKGEVYFSFEFSTNKNLLDKISNIISIDHKTNKDIVFAYANKKEFENFLNLNIKYKIISKKKIQINDRDKNILNYYPAYQEYVNMMTAFSDSFPSICKLHDLGTLPSGRKILIVQISNNVGQKKNKPSFLYTSTMHGDELTGYILSLRLIDYILNEYNNDQRLTDLVNNIDIWINPLANPDGAYAGGNQGGFMNMYYNATRYNANNIDLNRNFPDPEDGPHPDGYPYQTETNIFLSLADTINFNMAANMHGGAEVCNYAWDTWNNLTADNNWWLHVLREYADSCQANSNSGYFEWSNGCNPFANGVVNGSDWYKISGGRQDYMNYFRYCKEFTLELSDEKTPNPNDLEDLWNANYPSLINYLEQSLFGVRGLVTDSVSGNPIKAKVQITNHDIDSSHVYSNLPIGNYHRYLYQGNYNITFSKSGYHSKTINVSILNNTTVIENIKLVPLNSVGFKDINIISKIINSIDLLGRDISKGNKILIHILENGTTKKTIKFIE